MKYVPLVLLLVLQSASFILAEEPPSIRKLGLNESLSVTVTSTGCFHHCTDIIVLTSKQASIFTLTTKWSEKEKKHVETGRKHLGVTNLSDEDITKLDALFKFYAGVPRSSCTTVDHIKVTLLKNEKKIKKYQFTDGSCDTYDMDSVLTFGSLKRRLKKHNKS